MLGCNRRPNRAARRTRIAFVFVAFGVALALGHDGFGPLGKVGEAQAQEQESAAQTRPTKEDKPHKPGHYKKHCGEPQTYEEADLCQQWRVAKATEKIRALTASQNTLSRREIGLLTGTLIASALAAAAAGWAAIAASKSVSVAREIGEAQARAYLSIEAIEIGVTGDEQFSCFTTKVKVSNAGQSPARNVLVHILMGYNIIPGPHEGYEKIVRSQLPIRDVHAGGEADTGIIMFAQYPDYTKAVLETDVKCQTFAEGHLEYFDVFGRRWEIPFKRTDYLDMAHRQKVMQIDMLTSERAGSSDPPNNVPFVPDEGPGYKQPTPGEGTT